MKTAHINKQSSENLPHPPHFLVLHRVDRPVQQRHLIVIRRGDDAVERAETLLLERPPIQNHRSCPEQPEFLRRHPVAFPARERAAREEDVEKSIDERMHETILRRETRLQGLSTPDSFRDKEFWSSL